MQFLNRCLAPLPKIVPGTIAAIFVLISLSACTEIAGGGGSKSPGVVNPFPTFKDVPGITEEEIAAIEALQREYESFSFGGFPSTETFVKENGEVSGLTALLCNYLTDFFGIPFTPVVQLFNALYAGLTNPNHTIDFMGNPSLPRKKLRISAEPLRSLWLSSILTTQFHFTMPMTANGRA